jgi:hypothetical protein
LIAFHHFIPTPMKTATLYILRLVTHLPERVLSQLFGYYANWRQASAALEREY